MHIVKLIVTQEQSIIFDGSCSIHCQTWPSVENLATIAIVTAVVNFSLNTCIFCEQMQAHSESVNWVILNVQSPD